MAHARALSVAAAATLAVSSGASPAGAQASPWQAPPTQPAPAQPPPGQGPPGGAPTQTEMRLREAEARDSGRGLEKLWVAPEIGFVTARFGDFGGGSVSRSGVQVGTGVGARLLFFTLGVRGRLAFLDGAKLFSVGPEAGFHVPLGNLEPYGFLGAGYSSLGGLEQLDALKGFHARLGAGIDRYVTPQFSIGGLGTAELVRLTRGAVDGAAGPLADARSSMGTAFTVSLVLGLHL